MCSGTVAEVIQSVVNGADGCIFCFGQVKLGKLHRWPEIKQQHLSTKKKPSVLFVSSARSPQLVYQCSGVSQGMENWWKGMGSECVCVCGGCGQGKVLDLSFTL